MSLPLSSRPSWPLSSSQSQYPIFSQKYKPNNCIESVDSLYVQIATKSGPAAFAGTVPCHLAFVSPIPRLIHPVARFSDSDNSTKHYHGHIVAERFGEYQQLCADSVVPAGDDAHGRFVQWRDDFLRMLRERGIFLERTSIADY